MVSVRHFVRSTARRSLAPRLPPHPLPLARRARAPLSLPPPRLLPRPPALRAFRPRPPRRRQIRPPGGEASGARNSREERPSSTPTPPNPGRPAADAPKFPRENPSPAAVEEAAVVATEEHGGSSYLSLGAALRRSSSPATDRNPRASPTFFLSPPPSPHRFRFDLILLRALARETCVVVSERRKGGRRERESATSSASRRVRLHPTQVVPSPLAAGSSIPTSSATTQIRPHLLRSSLASCAPYPLITGQESYPPLLSTRDAATIFSAASVPGIQTGQTKSVVISLAWSVANPQVHGLAVPHPCSHHIWQQREQYLSRSIPRLGLPNPV